VILPSQYQAHRDPFTSSLEKLWPEQEFRTHKVSLVNGEQVSLGLAERGLRLSNDICVREVRHLSEKRHQSSI
jgi:hypothetical protein